MILVKSFREVSRLSYVSNDLNGMSNRFYLRTSCKVGKYDVSKMLIKSEGMYPLSFICMISL